MAGQPAPGSNVFITFDVTGVEIRENPAPNILGDPTTIIPSTSGFQAQVSFVLAGLFANFVVNTGAPFELTLRAESLGGGFEGDLGTINGTLQAGELSYGPGNPTVPTVGVAPGTLAAGVYKLVAVVTFTGTNPPALVGFSEGPIIQII